MPSIVNLQDALTPQLVLLHLFGTEPVVPSVPYNPDTPLPPVHLVTPALLQAVQIKTEKEDLPYAASKNPEHVMPSENNQTHLKTSAEFLGTVVPPMNRTTTDANGALMQTVLPPTGGLYSSSPYATSNTGTETLSPLKHFPFRFGTKGYAVPPTSMLGTENEVIDYNSSSSSTSSSVSSQAEIHRTPTKSDHLSAASPVKVLGTAILLNEDSLGGLYGLSSLDLNPHDKYLSYLQVRIFFKATTCL